MKFLIKTLVCFLIFSKAGHSTFHKEQIPKEIIEEYLNQSFPLDKESIAIVFYDLTESLQEQHETTLRAFLVVNTVKAKKKGETYIKLAWIEQHPQLKTPAQGLSLKGKMVFPKLKKIPLLKEKFFPYLNEIKSWNTYKAKAFSIEGTIGLNLIQVEVNFAVDGCGDKYSKNLRTVLGHCKKLKFLKLLL